MSDVINIWLKDYRVKRYAEQGFHEHYFDLGEGRKAYISPLEHLAILTWHCSHATGGMEAPILFIDQKNKEAPIMKINMGNINDHDVVRMLWGGCHVEAEDLRFYLAENGKDGPIKYHDTIPYLSYGQYHGEMVWLFDPQHVPENGIVLKRKFISDDTRKLR